MWRCARPKRKSWSRLRWSMASNPLGRQDTQEGGEGAVCTIQNWSLFLGLSRKRCSVQEKEKRHAETTKSAKYTRRPKSGCHLLPITTATNAAFPRKRDLRAIRAILRWLRWTRTSPRRHLRVRSRGNSEASLRVCAFPRRPSGSTPLHVAAACWGLYQRRLASTGIWTRLRWLKKSRVNEKPFNDWNQK